MFVLGLTLYRWSGSQLKEPDFKYISDALVEEKKDGTYVVIPVDYTFKAEEFVPNEEIHYWEIDGVSLLESEYIEEAFSNVPIEEIIESNLEIIMSGAIDNSGLYDVWFNKLDSKFKA